MQGHSIKTFTFDQAWSQLLRQLYSTGTQSAPRGIATRELIGVSIHVQEALSNILVCEKRNPSYRFMLAEFLWIASGRDDLAGIEPFNKKIAQFSDNGRDFYGAYGPRVRGQLHQLVNKLILDPGTRQAVMSIWRQNPPDTKDTPCTLTFQVLLRDEKLHAVVNMRSSDIWLGLPYDFFNFSMLMNIIAASLGVKTGAITFNLGSSHLYESDLQKAGAVLEAIEASTISSPPFQVLTAFAVSNPMDRVSYITEVLSQLLNVALKSKADPIYRCTVEGRLGSAYVKALLASTNKESLDVLQTLHR